MRMTYMKSRLCVSYHKRRIKSNNKNQLFLAFYAYLNFLDALTRHTNVYALYYTIGIIVTVQWFHCRLRKRMQVIFQNALD